MKLHKIQKKILDLFTENPDFIEKSLRDIGEIIGEGRSQPQKINHHIKQLEKKGFIKRDALSNEVVIPKSPFNIVNIPLFAIASCGDEGLFDQENLIENIPLPSKSFGITDPDKFFLVKAIGNSMEPLIFENDLILCEKTYFSDSRIYIVIHNGLPKIKKVEKTNKGYKLLSANKNYKDVDILISDDFSVEGVVKTKISNFSNQSLFNI